MNEPIQWMPWSSIGRFDGAALDVNGEYLADLSHAEKDSGGAADWWLTPLCSEGFLAVDGVDAAKFLQGQLTVDLRELKGSQWFLGACCTPKGRMVSSFSMTQWPQKERILLRMHRPLVVQFKDYLQKYSVFFKVKMFNQSYDYFGLGLWGTGLSTLWRQLGWEWPSWNGATAAVGRASLVLRWQQDRVELWLPAEDHAVVTQLTELARGYSGTAYWYGELIRSGVGAVREATREHFLPQMLNLQHLSGLSFTKGCYTGQEIIARLQHLGTLKRALFPFHLDGSERPQAGAAIGSPAKGASVGEVVMSGLDSDGQLLVSAVVEKQYRRAQLYLADSKRPLQLLPLPYPLEGD